MKKILLFTFLLSIFNFTKFLVASNKNEKVIKIAKISGGVLLTIGLIYLILKKDKSSKVFDEKFEQLKKNSTSFLKRFSKNNKI